MPRNGSGTYTLPAGNPVEAGTLIEANWANTTLEDIGNEITDSLSRTGEGGMLAPFRLADGSLSTPGIAWLNEPSTGFYRAGSGEMWGVVGGTQILQYTISGVLIPSGKTLTAQGNVTVGGTLNITGAVIFGGALDVTGNFAVNTNKFTVAASSGNTVVAGTLGVTGAITATGGLTGAVTSSNATITGGSITNITDLAVADGGTGASTAAAARVNLLPSYTGNALKFLRLNSGGTDVEWATEPSVGTVTSVDVSGGSTGLSFTGGPITSSGTITMSGTLAVANGGTGATSAATALSNLGALPTAGGTMTGSLAFSGTGLRITGDFSSNTPISDRIIVQTSTTNGNTLWTIMPNGTSTTSRLIALNNSTPTNSNALQMSALSTDVRIQSFANGSATALPLYLMMGGTTVATVSTGNNFLVGTTTDDGSNKLQVTGNTALTGTLSVSSTATLSGLTASTALALDASKNIVSVTNTGSGNNVLATSPTLVTPVLGTPTSGTLTNCTGLPVSSGVSGLGTGVATALAVNTGSAGAFVVNGGALGTPSSGTVTNLTGTASININGTVGATTAAAGTFTSLSDSGNLTFTGTGNRITGDFSNATFANRVAFQTSTSNGATTVYAIPNGTSTTSGFIASTDPSVANGSEVRVIVNGTTAQITSSARGSGTTLPLTFDVGTERMRIDTSGNVGIGNSTVRNKLDVVGNTGIYSTSATSAGSPLGAQLYIGDSNYNTASYYNAAPGLGAVYDATYASAAALAFYTYAGTVNSRSERMRIDSSGNVGIGTTSPANKLDVVADGFDRRIAMRTQNTSGSASIEAQVNNYWSAATYTGTALVQYDSAATGTTVGLSNANLGVLRFQNGSAGLIYTNGSQPIVFGTVGSERMRIDSSGNVGIGTSSPSGKLNVSDGTVIGEINPYSAASGCYIGTRSNHAILFEVNASEKARIDTSGNLLVGTTSTLGGKLSIKTSGETNAYLTNDTAGGYIIDCDAASNGGTYYFINFRKTGTGISNITSNGTTVAYNTGSDYRLKDNIQPIKNALETVAKLKPSTWDWKKFYGSGSSQGFVAHELQAVIPDCVTGEKDEIETYIDEKGVEQIRPKYQGVDTSFLVATLTAAIQELKAELDATKAEIAALKGA